ncbi:hypothetical protein NQ317_018708 [Molorchus minor]|uniref:THD domain-containing protein n=1 Tax=Molorchus minor TaxID=1323400 RepID=A0ABQ9JQR8_9CUCU|nr:hypothetical protein NQ317_018708 [Molorchus minor]
MGVHISRNNQKCFREKCSFLLVSVFLVVLNTLLSIFAIYTLLRVKKLEYEVELLSFSRIKNLEVEVHKLKDVLSDINIKYNDQDWTETYEDTHDVDTGANPKIYMGEIEESPKYFEYDSYDQASTNSIDNTNDNEMPESMESMLLVNNLTKQGKASRREKRNIVASTQDGILINSESYAEKRARNSTRHRSRPRSRYVTVPMTSNIKYKSTPIASSQRHSDSHLHSSYAPSKGRHTVGPSTKAPAVYTRRSRVKHTEDKSKAFRQIVRKSSLKSGDPFNNGQKVVDRNFELRESGGTSYTGFTVVRDETLGRRYQPLDILDVRHPRVGRIKLASVHFSGDTSKYVVGQHTNFNGNGHLRHPQPTFVDWKISDWVSPANMDTHFTMDEGVLTIKEPGIYFIYAQIYYLDEHDTIGFRVHKNRDTILQCTITAHSAERRLKGNTCYTAGMEYLSEGDTVSLADVTNGRYSLFEPGKSFFGLVKFGDIKIK